MIGQVQHLIAAAANGTAITNSAAVATLLPTAAVKTLQPSLINYVGQELSLEAAGRISCVAGVPGNITFAFKLGATNVAVSQAIALNTAGVTNLTWRLKWDFTIRAVGAAANLMHTGTWISGASAGSGQTVIIPTSAPAVGSNFSSLIALDADFTAQFSVADLANSIQLHQYRLFSYNDLYG